MKGEGMRASASSPVLLSSLCSLPFLPPFLLHLHLSLEKVREWVSLIKRGQSRGPMPATNKEDDQNPTSINFSQTFKSTEVHFGLKKPFPRTFCSSRLPSRLASHRSIAARALTRPLFSPDLPGALLLESKHSLPRVCLTVRAKNTKPSLRSRLDAHNPARAATPTIHLFLLVGLRGLLCCLRHNGTDRFG